MNIDRLVFAIAGALILISVGLAVFVHTYWHFLTVFVGLNMFQAAFTTFCPLAKILKGLGFRSGAAFK